MSASHGYIPGKEPHQPDKPRRIVKASAIKFRAHVGLQYIQVEGLNFEGTPRYPHLPEGAQLGFARDPPASPDWGKHAVPFRLKLRHCLHERDRETAIERFIKSPRLRRITGSFMPHVRLKPLLHGACALILMTNLSTNSRSGKPLILVAICMAALVLPLSFTGGAVAIPAIGRDLGGSPVALNWITNAFMLSFGSLLMAAGALADQFGRRRLFGIGMALFTATSIALSFAPSVLALDLLRAVQGVAAAAALASGTAALAQEFEGHALTRAFSMLGTTFGIGLAFGPLIAGVLIESIGWRSIFITTAVIGSLSLIFGIPRMRETRDPNATGLDWPGTITFTGTLGLFTFALIQAPESGWGSPLIILLMTLAAALLAAFVLIETRVAKPMLDLSLFRIPRFVGVQVLPIGTCYSYIVLVVLLPLRFIGAEGLSEINAGWLMLALSAPMLVVPTVAASLSRRFSPGVLAGSGFLIAAVGLAWLSQIHIGAPHSDLIFPMLLIGIGAGLPWGLMDGLSVSVVPKERAGMASGIFSTARVAGEGIALAISGVLLAALSQSGLRSFASSDSPDALAQVTEAGQRIASGDITNASALLPGMSRSLLVATYDSAFQNLIYILIAITVLSAFVVFAFLSKAGPDAAAIDDAGNLPSAAN